METAIRDLAPEAAALSLVGVSAAYGRSRVLTEVNLEVPAHSIVALLGPNGAGKTTLLRVAAGLLRSAGDVRLGTATLNGLSPARRRDVGLCLVPEGRGVFPSLTVRENVYVQVERARRRSALEKVLDVFPALADRLGAAAGSLSGGQQQMLALARCYVRNAKVVLVDEASMGLAPLVIDQVYEALRRLNSEGVSLLIVEQYVDRALDLADTAYVLERGHCEYIGRSDEVQRDDLARRYLGGGSLTPRAAQP